MILKMTALAANLTNKLLIDIHVDSQTKQSLKLKIKTFNIQSSFTV